MVRTKRDTSPPEIIIIGAGLGGLALACRLAKQGKKVDIYEKNAFAGGRIAQHKVKGYTIDLGPTLLLMPHEFEELFSYCGKKMSDYVPIEQLHPHYRLHFWNETTLDVSSNLPFLLSQIEKISPHDKQGLLDFLSHENKIYEKVYPTFIANSPPSMWKMVFSGKFLKMLNADGDFSLWELTNDYFWDERIALAFSFQSMYLGQSPAQTPATYGIIPYVELTQGVWFPPKGMQSLVLGIEKLATELGVKIRYGKKVKEILIENKKAVGVKLEIGSEIRAERVVCNLDLPAAYANLIPESQRKKYTNQKLQKMEYGCSAFMLYLGVDKDYPQLLHHNVFFSNDFLHHFHQLFVEKRIPDELNLYLNVPTRTNSPFAPKGKHLLYVLVPVPNQKENRIDWVREKESFSSRIIEQLEKYGLKDLSKHVKMKKMFTPDDWESLAGVRFSSTFGLSPTFFQSSIFRPNQKSEEFKDLFFVGASTHPGSGMPMVLISARTCEKLISQD